MNRLNPLLCVVIAALMLAPHRQFAANHRDAPITALDHKADITDVFAFRSYDGGSIPKVKLILCVDPLQEPANGPNWWPFDQDILYEIRIDNNDDAIVDISFHQRAAPTQLVSGLR